MAVHIGEITGVIGVISVTIAVISAAIQYSWHITQSQHLHNEDERLHQEARFHRESHNLKLFEALSSDNHRLQLAAAAVLAERLVSNEENKEAENRTIIRALLAVTKDLRKSVDDPIVPMEISKFVADVVKTHGQPLKQFDLQNTRLSGAWWKGVDASEVDFWRADLSYVGMRNAILRCSVLVEAKLDGSVLAGADLTNARLERASLLGTDLRESKLEGANFAGAIYNDSTLFPEGFDPVAEGLIPKKAAPVEAAA